MVNLSNYEIWLYLREVIFFIYCLCVFCLSKYKYVYIAYYPLTDNVESSVPLMLDNDDDVDVTTANTKYYSKQCMHLLACFINDLIF